MFADTRPADLDAAGGADAWAAFRVTQAAERLQLLRALRDGSVPVILNAPEGSAYTTLVWAVDDTQQRLNLSADPAAPQLARVIEADEAVAVAYLDSVKLQFDLHGFTLVRGAKTSALQCALPREIHRFQRRAAYRVRPRGALVPTVALRHPALPEMQLALRVLDLSIGGCALWLPTDVPPMQAGTRIAGASAQLDAETRFQAELVLQHVSVQGEGGARLGCEWCSLTPQAERALQRWIDRSQQRARLLGLG